MDIEKLFEGMESAKMFGRGNYMGEGNYTVQIKKVFPKKSFKGAELLIVEFEVVESDNEKHKPGSTGTWAPKLALPNTFGDIKVLLFSVLGRSSSDVPEGDIDAHRTVTLIAKALCGSEKAKQELAGKPYETDADIVIGATVKLQCSQVKTKVGGDFTRYTWSPAT